MSDLWSNGFSFVLVTSRKPVFQNCKEILFAESCSLPWAGRGVIGQISI